MSQNFLLTPLETPPAYAAVVDRIRRAVQLGVLLPGDRLPSERALAEGLQVSRVTVREALRVLQGERLLLTRRGSAGTTVSPSLPATGAWASSNDEHLQEVFELRLAVETMAARLAATRGSEEDVFRLDSCQDALASSTDVNSFRRADSEFHLCVAQMSGNTALRHVIEDARAAAFSTLDRRNFTIMHETSRREHAAIIDAIKNGDPQAAADAMAEHIELARREVVSILAGDPAVETSTMNQPPPIPAELKDES